MSRHRVTLGLVAVLAAAGLGACSPDGDGEPPTDGGGAAPASASVTPSVLPPVTPRPVVPPAGRAPAQAFAVGTRTLALRRGPDRPLPTTVWYPATGTPGTAPTEGAPTAVGRFPLVLFSHGLTAAPGDYAAMLTRWAQAGFVVAAPAYPRTSSGVARYDPSDLVNQPADGTQVITDVLALNGRPGDALRGRIDAGRVAAAGHSGGGVTTVGMLTADRDDRLDAAVVLAGRQVFAVPFRGAPAPVFFVHGRLDDTVPYADGLATFQAVPWSRALLTITEGGHVTTSQDFEVTVSAVTEFLRWSLYGDATAKARLAQQATRGGVATLTDQL